MALAFQAISAVVSGTGTTDSITWPGAPGGQQLIAVFAFEGVAAGSGPYISSAPFTGSTWFRIVSQAPSATGVGLEVWAGFPGWSSGVLTPFAFTGTYTYIGRGIVYTGQNVTGVSSSIRSAVSAQVVGNNPQAPTIFAFANEMVVAIAAEQMSNPGFGTPTSPTGFTQRYDSNRAGFGTVEQTVADELAIVNANVGPIGWTANGQTGASPGASATLAIQPAGAAAGSGNPLIEVTFPVT